MIIPIMLNLVEQEVKKYDKSSPITNTGRANLLHVELDKQTHTTGFVMCEQAKVLDITTRNYQFIEKAPSAVLYKVLNRVQAISLPNAE